MRAWGEKIDIAEQYCNKILIDKQNQYRFIKENEIKQNLKDYQLKNGWWYDYEIVNLRFYTDGRVLEIWIMDWLKDNNQTKRASTIDIEERQNPIYFKELMKRFKLED